MKERRAGLLFGAKQQVTDSTKRAMASDSGIPVVGLGIDGAVAHQVSVKLLPEYDGNADYNGG